jgi:hypothetical protein
MDVYEFIRRVAQLVEALRQKMGGSIRCNVVGNV